MNRRNMLWSALVSLGAGWVATPAQAATEAPIARQKVVYHLADSDRVNFALGNIQNHLDGMGGPEHVSIVLVVLGPALRGFHRDGANPDITQRVAKLAKAGVGFAACKNTMKAQDVALDGLLPGVAVADKGGVVRIAELQAQGFAYIRP
jgi:intracellular sulfur oxidation DsrE/DsrF family protein